jgi:hypothetical protein
MVEIRMEHYDINVVKLSGAAVSDTTIMIRLGRQQGTNWLTQPCA